MSQVRILPSRPSYPVTGAGLPLTVPSVDRQVGWRSALSIDDQVRDMSDGSADLGFPLPNPMYFIP